MINNTHTLIKNLMLNIPKVDIAVDCTCGNGNDSLNIIEILRPKYLYCIDIQKLAIENTKKLLQNRDYTTIKYLNINHSKIDEYINTNIDFSIFNLGYLPNSNHKITTNYKDVLIALDILLKKLNKTGYIIITFYPGHESGKEEVNFILKYLRNLQQKEFAIIKYDFINQINNPPFVISIQKLK